MKIKQYAKMAAQNIYLPLVYNLHRHRKITPRSVLFADAHHDAVPANMKPLREELKRDGWTVREMYLDYQKASFGRTLRHMTAFMKAYAGSEAVVLCDNFLPAAGCRKRPQTKVVQLWHACGSLKKFGYATTDDIPASYRGNVFRNTDLVTVSAEACVLPFSEAMRLSPERVCPLGVSRTDRYFDPEWRKTAREHFLKKCPQAVGRKVVVWAPTFRGDPSDPEVIGLDTEALQEKLGDEWILLVKHHPHVRKAGSVAGLSMEELFAAADAMIADYSSLIYEYLLFEKPLVLYIPDYDSYLSQRGFFMPHEEIPGERIYEEKDLADGIRRACVENDSPGVVQARKAFLAKWMSACDGGSTRRIADWLEAEHA